MNYDLNFLVFCLFVQNLLAQLVCDFQNFVLEDFFNALVSLLKC